MAGQCPEGVEGKRWGVVEEKGFGSLVFQASKKLQPPSAMPC